MLHATPPLAPLRMLRLSVHLYRVFICVRDIYNRQVGAARAEANANQEYPPSKVTGVRATGGKMLRNQSLGTGIDSRGGVLPIG